MTTELIRYDAMCRAINEAHAVDEVKDIHDKSAALEYYARQARNHKAESRAAEIRIRAERKLGRLLKEMEKAKGARGKIQEHLSGSQAVRPPEQEKTLSDLGISKDQSSRYQQLAEVPDEDFEEAFESPVKATTSGILSKHRFKNEPQTERAPPTPAGRAVQ